MFAKLLVLVVILGAVGTALAFPRPPVCVRGAIDAQGGCWVDCPNVKPLYEKPCKNSRY